MKGTIVNSIEDQFTRKGYQASRNIGQLILNVFSQLICKGQLSDVVGIHHYEVDHYRLSTQLQSLRTKFIKSKKKLFLVLSTT